MEKKRKMRWGRDSAVSHKSHSQIDIIPLTFLFRVMLLPCNFTDDCKRITMPYLVGDVERLNGVDVASLPLLLPLLDFNITLPNGSNATLFDAALGDIFRLYKRKIQKKKAQKEEIKSAVVNYYKPKIESKRNGKGKKWKRWYKVSKLL